MKTFTSGIFGILFMVYIPFIGWSQVKDDFSDGNFSENPVWSGDTAHFEVNQAGQLHLHSAGTDTAVLVTPNTRIRGTEWRFWMKLSFNTSSNNHARIYLTADTSALCGSLNGYYIQAGGTDDSLYVMKQTGTVMDKIFNFRTYKTNHSTNTLRVKMICDDYGNWEALIDTAGDENYCHEGTFFDNSLQSSGWFGVYCRYTSSNSTKFYFDDFYVGPIIRDTLSPTIISQEVVNANTIQVRFSEGIDRSGAENPANYQVVSTTLHPDSVMLDLQDGADVSLFFHEPIREAFCDSLRVLNIQDLSGNFLADTLVRFCCYQPKAYDVVIHEIMADPDPPVELPDGEYVELYNRSQFPINIKEWSLEYGSNIRSFPSIIIPPNGFLLVVKDSAYFTYSNCIALFTSSSSLSNEGTALVLRDGQKKVIHSVSYSPAWHGGSFKEEGGWSLEMIDPSNPCGCGENWGSSKDPAGGTPGWFNSIYAKNPDLEAPHALRAVISDSGQLVVHFSEKMDSASLSLSGNWCVSPFETNTNGFANPVTVVPVSPDFTSAKLTFSETFGRRIVYVLTVSDQLLDCTGNPCDSSITIRFAIPDTVQFGDIVISEVLADPASGGARFVEFYNRSDKIIDLKSLVFSGHDTITGLLPDATPLPDEGFLVFPGEYIAITSNSADICDRYRPPMPESIISIKGFPVFNDDTGTVILARKSDLFLIDRMRYDPAMHYPLLATREGVSLERIHPEMPSLERNNWHSASETAGFATPGFRNSHWYMSGLTDFDITVSPEIFSPDNDGRDDLLNITIREKDPDYAVNIAVYDSRGRLIRLLVNNVLTGSEGIFTWDGMTENRGKAPLGFYILLIELTRPDGVIKRTKKTAILGGRI